LRPAPPRRATPFPYPTLFRSYREGHDVLHGISVDLRPGERLAVVGPSGAGKSTLGRMLSGVHPPTGGSVTVGGVPLVDLPLEDRSEEHTSELQSRENLVCRLL